MIIWLNLIKAGEDLTLIIIVLIIYTKFYSMTSFFEPVQVHVGWEIFDTLATLIPDSVKFVRLMSFHT